MINPNEFPIHALPSLLGNAINDVVNNIMVPIPIAVSSALGYLSLASQALADVERPNGMKSPTSLNFIVVAESGDRKSTADKIFMEPFRVYEQASEKEANEFVSKYEAEKTIWAIQHKALLDESKRLPEGINRINLVTRLQQHIEQKPKPLTKKRLIYKDVTIEALISGLACNGPSAGLISDEAVSILNGRAMSDLGMLNKLWDGGVIHIDRVTKVEAVLNNARLTCSFMTQKKVFSDFINKNNDHARSVGFLSRFLICMPLSLQGQRLISDTPQLWSGVTKFNARIAELITHSIAAEDKLTITFSHGAKTCWYHFYNEAEKELTFWGELSEVKDFGSKFAENIARMAALFHLLEGAGSEVSEKHMVSACEICKWYLIETRKLFKTNHQSEHGPNVIADALELYDWLKNHTANMHLQQLILVNKNNILQRGPNQLRNRARLNAAIDKLMQSNVLSRYHILGARRVVFQFFPFNYFDVYAGLV